MGEREDGFKKYVPTKAPKFVATRWNTLFDCLEFVLEHAEHINEFLEYQTKYEQEEYQKLFNKTEKKIERLITSGATKKDIEKIKYPFEPNPLPFPIII